jgi:hypothetical protein
MSSVQRFIRQIQPDNTYYSAATVLGAPASYAYELIPSAGAVGNYPAGYMAAASGALATALTAATYAANSALLRDMGKTIRAPVTSVSGNVGYFRQVQLLIPSHAGVAANVQGAVSVPDQYSPYLTFYVPVAIAGISAAAIPSHGLSGQM